MYKGASQPVRCLAALAVALAVAGCGSTARPVATARPIGSAVDAVHTPSAAPSVVPTEGVAGASSKPASIASSNPSLPAFDHVYMLVLENQSYTSLIGSAAAPYLNSLAAAYGVASNYHAVAHPSQPNYIALFAGSTNGVNDDGKVDLPSRNLFDQLEQHGKTWMVYEQSYPGDCFAGDTASGPQDGPGSAGNYARKHNPAISFLDIESDTSRCARIQNLSAFSPAAADLELVVPNECNDMHSCSVAAGDAFLRAFVPKIVQSPAFARSLLVITTDEGTDSSGGGGRVATVVASPLGRRHFVSTVPHDHYSVLRTVEDAWGLDCLEQACQANNLAEFFR